MKNLIAKLHGYWLGVVNFFAWMFQWLIVFKPYWKRVLKFFINWNEIITIPIGIAIFYFAPMLMRLADPSAAGYDLGILHSILFAIAAMLIINGFAFLIMKITFPGIYKFIDEVLEEFLYRDSRVVSNLTQYQKCVISLSVLSLYLLGTVLLVRVF